MMAVRLLRLRVVGLAVAVIVMAVVMAIYLGAGAESTQIALDGVNTEDLAAAGISVDAVDPSFVPSVSREDAVQTMAERNPNVAIKEVALVQLMRGPRGATNKPVWVVSLDTSDEDFVPEVEGGTTAYLIGIVDAVSGEFLFGASVTRPPEGGWPPGSEPVFQISAPAGLR